MLKIGEAVCRRCKQVHNVKEPTYYDQEENMKFRLRRRGTAYVAEILAYGRLSEGTNIVVQKVETTNGVPRFCRVVYKKDQKEVTRKTFTTAHRICPHCTTVERFMDKAGLYPSYIVAEIGSPETGKSTWLSAVTTDGVNRRMGNHNVDILMPMVAGVENAHNPTTMGEMEYHAMTIEENGRIIAVVYLLDLAGEFCKINNRTDFRYTELVDFLRKTSDGVMAFCDPRFVNSEEMDLYKEKRDRIEGNFTELYQELSEGRRKFPMGTIMTGADRIKAYIPENRIMYSGSTPLVTKETRLFKKEKLTEETLVKHIALSRRFIREGTNLRMSKNMQDGYFVISSGAHIDDRHIDYSKAYNVDFPLVWMLNQLGLMEL